MDKKLMKKLYKFWQKLAEGSIIIIYKDKKIKTIKKTKDILQKWNEFNDDKNVEAIIWSAQSFDVLQDFVNFLIKKYDVEELLKIKKLSTYILDNYKLFFKKYKLYSKKDYTLK